MTDAKQDEPDLEAIRARIDSLDEQIQSLISERARAAQAVGSSKLGEAARPRDFYRPEREAQVLRKVVERNQGPLRDEEMVRLFREIMSACLAQQEPLKVAFLGPEGTFTQAAVLKHFGHSIRALSLASIDEVFHEVESGVADFGIVPVENSTEGTVNNTLDMFMTSPLRICGEVELRIRQHLLGKAKSWRASSGSIPISSRWHSAAPGWNSSCRMRSASRSTAMPRPRGWRAMKTVPPLSPARPPPRSTV